jgi:hypothetical protein
VAGVARVVAAPVLDAGDRGAERDRADDQQRVVLPPAHDGQGCRGGEDDGDRPVVESARVDVPRAPLAGQGGGCPCDHRGEPGQDVDGEEGEEDGSGGAHLVAEDAAGRDHVVHLARLLHA